MNDQENGRSYVNVKVDRRAMRESDLLAWNHPGDALTIAPAGH
jgi:hypothetical protein